MSSTAYSAELDPDPRLRKLVIASGALLAISGIVMVALIDLSLSVKVVLGLAWALVVGRELVRHRRAYSRNGIMRVGAGGEIEVQRPDGHWRRSELCAGSMVLERLAWLRIRTSGRLKYAELLRGNSRESDDWRRLQVIWRHIGASRRSC